MPQQWRMFNLCFARIGQSACLMYRPCSDHNVAQQISTSCKSLRLIWNHHLMKICYTKKCLRGWILISCRICCDLVCQLTTDMCYFGLSKLIQNLSRRVLFGNEYDMIETFWPTHVWKECNWLRTKHGIHAEMLICKVWRRTDGHRFFAPRGSLKAKILIKKQTHASKEGQNCGANKMLCSQTTLF